MVLNDSQWFSVVFNHPQWFQWFSVVLSCDKSLQLVTSGSEWLPCSGSQWFSVVVNGHQPFSMATSGSQWLPVVLNGYQ